jgi:hypothetical protein
MAPLTIEDPLLERGLAVFEQALSNLDAAPAERSPIPPVSSSPARPHPAPVEEPGLMPPHHPAQSPPPPGRSLPQSERPAGASLLRRRPVGRY